MNNHLIETYISDIEASKSNANLNFSHSGLKSYISDSILKQYSIGVLGRFGELHKNGAIYLHNLDQGIYNAYCSGHSLENLLLSGLINPVGISSQSAKHFDVAMDHVVNFTYLMTQEFSGAQAFNDIDILMSPYIFYDNLNYKQVKQVVQRLIWNMSFPLRSGFQCLSEDTEILTNNGWKSYNDIIYSDIVATFNMENQNLEFKEIKEIFEYPYDGEMIHIFNNRTDQLITPNHRVIKTETINKSLPFVFCEADKLLEKNNFCVPITTKNYQKEDMDIPDYRLKLIAWIIAEGTIRTTKNQKTFRLYQSEKSIYLEEIRNLLKENDLTWYERSYPSGFGGNPIIRFNVTQNKDKLVTLYENIPNEFMNLSRRQAKLFLDEYRKGDGTKREYSIASHNEQNVNMIEALTVLCGMAFHSHYYPKDKGTDIRIISDFNTATCIRKYKDNVEKIKYKGIVWCVNTDNGTLITRRKNFITKEKYDRKMAITGNSVFLNFSLGLRPSKYYDNKPVIHPKAEEGKTYNDFQIQTDMFNKALLEIMIEGSGGLPFTFPLLTYKITKDFKWDSEISNLIFQYASKWGGPYFSNYLNTDFDENDALSMCCRLKLDVKEIQKVSGGLWSFGNNTGSIAVATINMAQLGYITKGNEDAFYLRLDNLLDEAKQYLILKKSYVLKGIDLGLYPMIKNYIGKKMASTYFLTIGINGLNECSMNFCGENIINNAKWCEEVLKHIKTKTLQFQQETGQLFNFEAVPAEGAGPSLAKIDSKNYPDMFIQGNDSSVYYTGSSFIPHNIKLSLSEAILHQEKLQRHYTGGTVFHIDSGECNASPESVKKIIKSVCEKTELPYITWSPTFCTCPIHGNTNGKIVCCENGEVISRIVGFYRPISRWQKGKKSEFDTKEFITCD